MHGDGRVAQHRLGARRCDDEMTGSVGQGITKVPQRAGLVFAGEHFQIGERGVKHRIPIDEALASVDEPFLVKAHKHFGDGAREAVVHREAIARPIDRVAESSFLTRNRVARLRLPFPHALHERFAPDVATVLAFRVELALHDHLRRDARVIGAGLPQRVAALHPVEASQRIHEVC